MLRDVRPRAPEFDGPHRPLAGVLVEHVHAQPAHFAFIARERGAGPSVGARGDPAPDRAVRRASSPPTWPGCRAPRRWSPEDLQLLADLIVVVRGHHGRAARRATRRRGRDRRPTPARSCGWCWSVRSTGARGAEPLACIGHGTRHRPRLPPPPANPFQRAGRRLRRSRRPGGWVFSSTLRHLDDAIGGSPAAGTAPPACSPGCAVLDLTTTGRKSGQRRTSHLISIPVGDDLALLGTNFGQRVDAGVGAQPRGRAARDRHLPRDQPRRRRPAGDRRTRPRRSSTAPRRIYGGYRKYRAAHQRSRRIRIFVLERAPEAPQVPGAARPAGRSPRGSSRRRGRSSTCRIVATTVSGAIQRDGVVGPRPPARAPSPASAWRSGSG